MEENRIQVEQNIVKMEEWEEFSMKTKGKNLSQLWKRNMVVAIAAVFAPRAKDRIKLIKECVEPLWEEGPS